MLTKAPLITPVSYGITGACMLADICGFTKFSGDLCNEGVNGLDKLRRVTSSFLSKFIDTIYFYYGDGNLFPFSLSPPLVSICLLTSPSCPLLSQ
jgi:hypothetical protein